MTALESLFGLKNKVAIVTGGARGIGKCTAENLAAVGADIVIFDILDELAESTAKEIASKYPVRTASFHCDVTKPQEVKEKIEAVAGKMGTLDLLFNNAGICIQVPVTEVTPEQWLKVVDVNLNGVFFMAQAFGKWLIDHHKGGSIVNTSSMSGIIVNIPQPQASYNTTKAGVTHLTKSLAIEWIDKGIRVNCISPGYIDTELNTVVRKEWRDAWNGQMPMRRMGKPQELAGAIIYLFSDSASYTTGCDIVVDGAFTAV
jgi:NAD(P)-dependent dehydrogenase (short-subunit alcohol dehydrogenase family)